MGRRKRRVKRRDIGKKHNYPLTREPVPPKMDDFSPMPPDIIDLTSSTSSSSDSEDDDNGPVKGLIDSQVETPSPMSSDSASPELMPLPLPTPLGPLSPQVQPQPRPFIMGEPLIKNQHPNIPSAIDIRPKRQPVFGPFPVMKNQQPVFKFQPFGPVPILVKKQQPPPFPPPPPPPPPLQPYSRSMPRFTRQPVNFWHTQYSILQYPVVPIQYVGSIPTPGFYVVPQILGGAPMGYVPYTLTEGMLRYNAFPPGFRAIGAFCQPVTRQKGFYDAFNRIYFPCYFGE